MFWMFYRILIVLNESRENILGARQKCQISCKAQYFTYLRLHDRGGCCYCCQIAPPVWGTKAGSVQCAVFWGIFALSARRCLLPI